MLGKPSRSTRRSSTTFIRRSGKPLGLFALACWIGLVPIVQAAQDISVSRERLRQINATISGARAKLKNTQQQQSAAQQSLQQAESALATTHAQIDVLASQQKRLLAQLQQLNARAATLDQERDAQRQALAAQMAALYRLGREPQLKLLLEQQDPTRLERYQRYFNTLDQARRDRLQTLKRLDKELSQNKTATEQRQRYLETAIAAQREREAQLKHQQDTRQQALDAVNRSYQNDQAQLTSLNQDRQQAEDVIARIEREVAAAKAAERARAERAARAEAEAARKRAQAERKQRPSTSTTPEPTTPVTPPPRTGSGDMQLTDEELALEAPGQNVSSTARNAPPPPASPRDTAARPSMPWQGRWPVEGRMLLGFGQGEGVDKNGILISASAGTPIHAMAAGQVVFADWLNGFGYLVIVDHGRAMSVYAHNQRNAVSVGDRVGRGAIIGTVGDTGGRSSPALYYEVRRNGKPIDPSSWSG